MDYSQLIKPENELEEKIISDPEWIDGANWGLPREGHPEDKNIDHIVEVLNNVDSLNADKVEREKLRLIAIIHDTFKNKVDINKPRIGDNNHAIIAAKFAEKYVNDKIILKIIKLHDEAFGAWKSGERSGDWSKAEVRLENLLRAIGEENLQLYYHFYKCDNETGNKNQDCLRWFEEKLKNMGLVLN